MSRGSGEVVDSHDLISPQRAEHVTDPAIASNLDYRWDGLHYYKPGSALYFQTAIPQLLKPLAPLG